MPRTLTADEIESFRDELCGVAERLFVENGYEGVTMRALATELGCSPMTPYRYFANKAEILTVVRVEAFVRFGEAMEALVAGHPDPIERTRAFGRGYLEFARKNPRAYRIMFELGDPAGLSEKALSDPTKRDRTLRAWMPLLGAMEESVERGLLFGDPLTLAHTAWIGLHGLVTLDLSNKLLLGRSYEELVEPTIEHFLRGAGAPPAESARGTGTHK